MVNRFEWQFTDGGQLDFFQGGEKVGNLPVQCLKPCELPGYALPAVLEVTPLQEAHTDEVTWHLLLSPGEEGPPVPQFEECAAASRCAPSPWPLSPHSFKLLYRGLHGSKRLHPFQSGPGAFPPKMHKQINIETCSEKARG